MDITVKSDDLVRELSLARAVISGKTTIPILSHVLLQADGSVDLQLSFTDTELALQSTCPAVVSAHGAVTVPCRKLEEAARSLAGGDLRIVQKKDAVALSSAGFAAKFQTQPADDFPALPSADGLLAVPLPGAAVRELIRRVRFAMTTNSPTHYLHGVQMELNADVLRFAATDAHRLAWATAPCAYQGEKIAALVPAKAVAELAELLDEAEDGASVDFIVGENHLFFRVGDRLLTSRKVAEGKFPDVTKLLPKKNQITLIADRSALAQAVRRAALVLPGLSSRIVMEFAADAEGKAAVCVAALSADGEAEDTVLVTYYDGEPMRIAMDAKYVADFLDVAKSAEVTLRLQDNRTPMLWSPRGDEDAYKYVVMPMAL